MSSRHGHSHGHGGHGHGHDHGHAHNHAHGANEKSVGIAALLTGAFMVVEMIGGVMAGSLTLIADAGHMLTDFVGLGMAWFAFRLTRKPADGKRTYGFDRFSVLVAFVNGLALFVIAGWITFEAWERFNQPVEVLGGLMFWVALAGLGVNILSFLILRRGDKENLNMRAAVLHVLGDLLGSVAAIIASLVIMTTGWMPIDPLLSVLVSLIILRSALRIVLESGHILLEGSPPHVDVEAIAGDLAATVDGVENVHHVHVWSITQERPMATLHARVGPGTDPGAIVAAIKDRLKSEFQLDHATVEIELGEHCPSSGEGKC
jgi:cobalt-zinc-cadmium efflux system protein